ncbi:MAG: sensor histidine kinase [Clostridia bacterium]|nr:sensor histidine kinase [Clostridia bacterium]
MLIKYLKQKYKAITAFFVFAVIFGFTFYLYGISVNTILYPLFLCIGIGAVILIIDYFVELKRYNELQKIKKTGAVLIDTLPKSASFCEETYKEIIELLEENNRIFIKQSDEKYDNMINYYTLWVHQIKSPIASMRLNIQNEDNENSKRLSYDLLRIENYVNMVLTFLRLDSKTTDFVFKNCDIDSLVKSSVKKFSAQFISKKLSFNYSDTKKQVLTDEKWLSFVVEQVISNAVKYTNKGGVTVALDENDILSISDTGIGILPSELPRIFENGFTGLNGRNDKKASGIGLYLCKRICDNLGHNIYIESKLDKGTTVYIDLSRKSGICD